MVERASDAALPWSSGPEGTRTVQARGRMAAVTNPRPVPRPTPAVAKNLADLYGLPLLDWDNVAVRLAEGVKPGSWHGWARSTHLLVGDGQRGRQFTRYGNLGRCGSTTPSGSSPVNTLGKGGISLATHDVH